MLERDHPLHDLALSAQPWLFYADYQDLRAGRIEAVATRVNRRSRWATGLCLVWIVYLLGNIGNSLAKLAHGDGWPVAVDSLMHVAWLALFAWTALPERRRVRAAVARLRAAAASATESPAVSPSQAASA
ncbi:MAG: hypothetical protein ACT4PU_08080 [Planctomycetota bacterium]